MAYSRIANRILMHIADFNAENFRELEKKAAEIPWELYLSDEKRVNIHVTCKHSRLYHSDAVAERLQKVIEGGSLPLAAAPAGSSATPSAGAPRNAPKSEEIVLPQNLYVTLIDDRCTLWLDLAGGELYKRGHERFVNDAPLKETIAAGMLFEAINLSKSNLITLIDPMAGSGTFSLEAAYMAIGLIPGKCRDFALKHQPAFKPATWDFLIRRETRDEIYDTRCFSTLVELSPMRRREGDTDTPHNLRFIVSDKVIQWHDLRLGDFAENPKLQCGDFPIRDREGQWTYQFAVCVDDIDEGITHIVRGEDIRSSTARQIALREALGAKEPPIYLHHALISDSTGKKLSKRELAYSLRQEREAGTSPETLLGRVCFKAKLQESPTPLSQDQAISLIESCI